MNREELLKAITDRQAIEVELSFGKAYVMPLTRSQFDHCSALAAKLQKDMTADRAGAVRWYAISNAWVDEKGSRILDPQSKEDRALFDSFKAGDTERLFEAILDSSTVSKEDRDFLSNG